MTNLNDPNLVNRVTKELTVSFRLPSEHIEHKLLKLSAIALEQQYLYSKILERLGQVLGPEDDSHPQVKNLNVLREVYKKGGVNEPDIKVYNFNAAINAALNKTLSSEISR